MSTTSHNQQRYLFACKSDHFYHRPYIPRLSTPDRWRNTARLLGLSKTALQHLEWIIYYHTTGAQDVTRTARHFGVSRKTLHKWLRRFDGRHFFALEEHSRSPQHKRQRMYTPL